MLRRENYLRWLSVGHRGRRILSAGAWSLVAKASAAANLFLSVPFVLEALGPVQFGAWATIVSLVAFAGFLDFGLGNGTMNLIAAAHARGSTDEVRAIYREGRRSMLKIAIGLATGVFLTLPFVPWHILFGLPQDLAEASRLSVAVVLLAIVLAIPLNLATRVQLGLGRGEQAFRWQAAGQVMTLVMVVVLARAGTSLPVLTAAAVVPQLLTSAANTLLLQRGASMASDSGPRRPHVAHRIRQEGLLFFVLQLSGALAFSADLPLISALRGASEAGTYAVVQRLFSVVPLSLGLIWAPLWPIYRQALATGNHQWVMRTLRRSLFSAILFASCAALTILVGFDEINSFWMKAPIAVSSVLLMGFAIWCVVEAAGTGIATFLNAASVMRYQVIVASVFAITCIIMKAWAIANLGIASLPWITAITYLLTVLAPTLVIGRRLLTSALSREY